MNGSAAAEVDSPSAREEDLPSPQIPTPSSYAAADNDINPNPSSSPDASHSSANSDPSPTDPDPPSAVAATSRLTPSPALLHPAAVAAANNNSSSTRRLPPPCWTHEETDALIQSYRQKWYALRRGNLRASHWEEVATAVADRCRHLYNTPTGVNTPKTAVQCRHKMEKLRKRYRSEKRRPHRTSWVHFREMDAMEMGTTPSASRGPGPAAAARSRAAVTTAAVHAAASDDNEDDDSDDDDDDDDSEDVEKNVGVNANTRSIHAVMSKANGGPAIGNLRFQIPKAVRTKVSTPRGDDRVNTPHNNAFNPKSHPFGGSNGYLREFPLASVRRSATEEMRKRVEERRRKEREGTVLGDMIAAVRALGDGFIRVEEMKMEMTKEMEKLRMEMELKRTEMILESQRRIVDALVGGFAHGKKKRAKVAPES